MSRYIFWFKEIGKGDIAQVGGKGANLGEITQLGIPVPGGFIVGVQAYFDFVKKNNLTNKVAEILKATNTQNPEELQAGAAKIKNIIVRAPVPDATARQIMKAYLKLSSHWGLRQALVAVRSSATAEDLPGASFAGQQETFLNVRGEANLVNRIRDCWASLFTPRAIFYREEKKFDHFKVGIAVPVQKMVQSEVSGVMFTVNPLTNDKKQIVIEAVWGLGETIVQGQVTPDYYQLEKETFKITKIQINSQLRQLIRKGVESEMAPVPSGLTKMQKLNSMQIVELAKIGEKIHQHYYFPQDIEWALEKGKLYIVQTRPVTTLSAKKQSKQSTGTVERVIVIGEGASPGTAQGKAIVISSAKEIGKVKKGEILVTKMTTPDFVPAMRLVNGIVTNEGGQTSHAAIVSRELGIPCVVGTKTATKKIKSGQLIGLDGKTGQVYLPSKKTGLRKTKDIKKRARKIITATKVYVNLGEPSLAAQVAKRDVDGVGLLRAEFMIAQIGTHPQEMIKRGNQNIFIDKLAQGMTKFCRAFHPRPVVYRTTDFKTNEYRNLKGGQAFEPKEENPLIGYRGAIRYRSSPDVFGLELEAIKKVRNTLRLKNLWIMIPFVRTPKELLEVKRMIASAGLVRSPSFKFWMMVEVPSNVILLKDFIGVGIDGISIGSNDLTMLTLGLDRDNNEIAFEFDERNKAVLWSLKRVIKIANKLGVTSSICGQAPSNYPDLTEKLVRWGITSVSVSPDMIETTREIISWAEKRVMKKQKMQ